MDYSDFNQALQKAGMTKKEFAALIGLNAGSVTNYAAAGAVPRHLAIIAVLCRELHLQGYEFRELIERVPKTEKKPRPKGFQGDRQRDLF